MSTIKLYTVSDDPKTVHKTLGTSIDLSGDFKEPLDVVHPVVTVQNDSDIHGVNYAYVTELGRYYYVRVVCTGRKLFRLEMTVDPLMSWETEIRALKALVGRNENTYDNRLVDAKTVNMAFRKVNRHAFATPFTRAANYVLALLGGNSTPPNQ